MQYIPSVNIQDCFCEVHERHYIKQSDNLYHYVQHVGETQGHVYFVDRLDYLFPNHKSYQASGAVGLMLQAINDPAVVIQGTVEYFEYIVGRMDCVDGVQWHELLDHINSDNCDEPIRNGFEAIVEDHEVMHVKEPEQKIFQLIITKNRKQTFLTFGRGRRQTAYIYNSLVLRKKTYPAAHIEILGPETDGHYIPIPQILGKAEYLMMPIWGYYIVAGPSTLEYTDGVEHCYEISIRNVKATPPIVGDSKTYKKVYENPLADPQSVVARDSISGYESFDISIVLPEKICTRVHNFLGG